MKSTLKIMVIIIWLPTMFSACGGETNVTFPAATLSSINVTPTSSTAINGTTQQFRATGTFSDGTTKDLTTSVMWSSSTTSVASISNLSGSNGVATSVAPGTTTIRATDFASKILGSATLTLITGQMGGNIEGNHLTLSAVVSTLAGTGGINGSTDGTGTAARFNFPRAITTDGANLYVSDNGCIIRKVVISSGVVTTLAGTAGAFGYLDGTGTAARFNGSNGLTTDGVYLYVGEIGNNTIRMIDISSGTVTTLAGSAGVSGSTDGIGAAARFNTPNGLTTDGTNLYVADSNNHTIRKIVISTGVVTTLAGSAGVSGSTDGIGTSALFNFPVGITTDGLNLYVTDDSAIRKIVISSGAVTTLAGTAGDPRWADGIGAAARFNSPYGITADGTYLYVPDTFDNTIRKVVVSTGEVTTLAGSAYVYGSVDGFGSAASFYLPNGITTDGASLYVADIYTIRTIN